MKRTYSRPWTAVSYTHLDVYKRQDYPTPDGTGVRDYIHVVDLAEGHVAAIEYARDHTGCEAFNLGTGEGYSVLDIVRAFERVNHIKVPYEIAPRRAGDPPTVFAKVGKAERLDRKSTRLNSSH